MSLILGGVVDDQEGPADGAAGRDVAAGKIWEQVNTKRGVDPGVGRNFFYRDDLTVVEIERREGLKMPKVTNAVERISIYIVAEEADNNDLKT